MSIVCLSPSLLSLVEYFKKGRDVIGVSEDCDLANFVDSKPQIVTGLDNNKTSATVYDSPLPSNLVILPTEIQRLNPTHILAEGFPNDEEASTELLNHLKSISPTSEIKLFTPTTLEQIQESCIELADLLGVKPLGVAFSHLVKAQLMDWADNFHERTKGKRVSFLGGVEPLKLSGLWIPDLIGLCSSVSQHRFPGQNDLTISSSELIDFKPDVIIVGPAKFDIKSSVKLINNLKTIPGWDNIPAVKRGEVIFCDGSKYFHQFGPAITDSMAILISAIGGMDSGYITPREVFYRIRYIELHRHRFL